MGAPIDPETGLTLKARKFADLFLTTGDLVESYIGAGYTGCKSQSHRRIAANKLYKKPEVRNYIENCVASKSSETVAKQDEVLEFLTSVMRAEPTEEVVGFLPGVGALKATKEPSHKDRLRAAELLGKRYMLFTDKVNTDNTTLINFVDDL